MNVRRVPRAICAVLGTASIITSAAAQGTVAGNTNLAGNYQLEGVREVGAVLRLGADGRFEFGMAYGGADRSAQGRWNEKGGVVTLTADKPPPAGFNLNSSSTGESSDYDKHPDKPTLLVVEVKTSRLGLVWSSMAVSAEFSNGQTRSGVTGSNGQLGFLARSEPEWKGAYVRRVSVAYPKAKVATESFSVDSRVTKSISISFEPGDLAPQAFERATFGLRGNSAKSALLQQSQEGPGEIGWVFLKQ